MVRVTVFALEACPHCKRAKGALKQRNIPFSEISLSTHPNRRSDMLALSDRLTVPQIFFGETHIGGADDTLALLEAWDKDDPTNKSPLERYEVEYGNVETDPTDPRLRLSTEPPVVPKAPVPRPNSDRIDLPDGVSKASVLDTMERLKKALPREEKPYNVTIYKNCFTGAACVKALMKSYECSEEKAVAFGQQLQAKKLITHVVDDHKLEKTNDYYFRLQCFQTPEILNSYRLWWTTTISDTKSKNNDNEYEDAVGLVTRLKKQLGKIESAVTNDQGEVNYKAAPDHKLFPAFDEAVCELQSVDMGGMDRNAKLVSAAGQHWKICVRKTSSLFLYVSLQILMDHTKLKAFGINLYNLMIKFAFMKVGIGSSSVNRNAFFTIVKFNIGGHLYRYVFSQVLDCHYFQ